MTSVPQTSPGAAVKERRREYDAAIASVLDSGRYVLGKAVEGAMGAMGRQPEAIGQIQVAMIIGCAFIEALTIYALVATIMLMGNL